MRTVLLSLLLVAASAADGSLSVVASTSNMGMLARAVGGDFVKVTVLAPPDRDPHTLQARPSMMVALRGADLLVSVGAELEVGWLPAGLSGASNPKILPGQPGYFEAAAQISLIERSGDTDRSRGDVHPMGNPHVFLDPERMAAIAKALGGRLGQLDPAHAAAFAANAEAFTKGVAERVPRWKAETAGARGAVLYHKDANYLFALLGVPVLGYVEPLPGIPPTAQHLSDLVARLTGTKGVVVYTDYQPSQGADFVAGKLGWKAIRLPIEAGPAADSGAYFKLIDRWVEAVALGR